MAVAFSPEAEAVMHRGFARARALHHLSMTVEHLVLEMLKESPVVAYLVKCGTDIETLKALLEAQVASFRTAQLSTVDAQANDEFARMVRRAIDDAGRERRTSIVLHDLFLAILEEERGHAAALLRSQTSNPAAFDSLRAQRASLSAKRPG